MKQVIATTAVVPDGVALTLEGELKSLFMQLGIKATISVLPPTPEPVARPKVEPKVKPEKLQ